MQQNKGATSQNESERSQHQHNDIISLLRSKGRTEESSLTPGAGTNRTSSNASSNMASTLSSPTPNVLGLQNLNARGSIPPARVDILSEYSRLRQALNSRSVLPGTACQPYLAAAAALQYYADSSGGILLNQSPWMSASRGNTTLRMVKNEALKNENELSSFLAAAARPVVGLPFPSRLGHVHIARMTASLRGAGRDLPMINGPAHSILPTSPSRLDHIVAAARDHRGADVQQHQELTTRLSTSAPVHQRKDLPYSKVELQQEQEQLYQQNKQGTFEQFPEKLHRMLMEVEAEGYDDIISFTPKGTAFKIHKPDDFFAKIVPKYFKQSQLSSFKRQLNLYGFEKIVTTTVAPTDMKGSYFHKHFQKQHPEMCQIIRRRDLHAFGSKQSTRRPKVAPDFYNMKPISGAAVAPQKTAQSSAPVNNNVSSDQNHDFQRSSPPKT
jgi:hypothetical protein